jgi:WD40 repeat protein
VRIWKLSARTGGQKPKVQQEACFDDHEAEVWRVEWNITGTVLASSGDDGVVRLWKPNFKHKWTCLSVVSPEVDQGSSPSASSASSFSQRSRIDGMPAAAAPLTT